MQPQEIQALSDRQYRSLVTIWGVLFCGLAPFFALCALSPPPSDAGLFGKFWYAIIAFSAMCIIDSFVIKRRFLGRAINRHDPSMVNKAYIAALALCEAAGLFGVLLRLESGFTYYYISFGLAALGMLFHFPRREHVLASYIAG